MTDKVDDLLNKYHLRKTIQRTLILQYLLSNSNHPRADQIFQYLKDQNLNISLATIYKNLNQLLSLHIIKAINDSDGFTHYDLNNTPHYHLICRQCGSILDINYDCFEQDEQKMFMEAKKKGYLDLNSDINVYGICPECQKKITKD